MRDSSIIHSKINYFLLFALVIVVPFCIPYLTPAIGGLLLLNWFIEGKWKRKLQRIDTLPKRLFTIASFSLFLFYCIGFLYAPDAKMSIIALAKKIWLLVTPLILFANDEYLFDSARIKKLFKVYIYAVGAMMILNLGINFVQFLQFPTDKLFTYKWLSFFSHPSYCSMYICTALLLAVYLLFIDPERKEYPLKNLLILFLPLAFFFIILLQSKTGLIALFFVIQVLGIALYKTYRERIFFVLLSLLTIIFSIQLCISIFTLLCLTVAFSYYKKKNRKLRFLFPFTLYVILLFSFTSYKIIDETNNRTSVALKTLRNLDDFVHDLGESDVCEIKVKNSSTQRVTLLKTSIKVAKEQPLWGYGTGSARIFLHQQFVEDENVIMQKKFNNCHNQYFETILDIGFLGIISLIFYLFIPFYYGIRYRNILCISFVVISALNFMTESMMEYYIGSDFIISFMGLFFLYMLSPNLLLKEKRSYS